MKTKSYSLAKRQSLFLLALFLCSITTTFAQSIVAKHGRLRVSGNQIVDKNNQPVSLAGNSFFWSNATDTSDFYNAETVKHLATDWNSSIVRVAMGVKETWDGGTGYVDSPDFQKAKIKKVIDQAIASGVYVIIDWHTHEAEKYTQQAVTFFREMARTYGNTPNVIYEVYNEPIRQSWGQIKQYSETVIRAIRAEDPDNLVIVGSPTWSQDVDLASNDPVNDANTAYTLHFYSGTHKQFLRDKAKRALDNGVALFVTEWGAVNANGDGQADRAETQRWMDFFKANNISHVNWSVSDKREGSSIVSAGQKIAGLKNDQLTDTGRYIKGIIKNWSAASTPNPTPTPTPQPTNNAPTAQITSPNNNATFNVGSSITINANATDNDGSIARVEFYNGNTRLSQDTTSPYSYTISNASAGNYNLTVIAVDNDGATTRSGQVSIRVNAVSNPTPTPTPTPNPTSNCAFGAPRSSALPSVQTSFANVYVLGNGGPDMSKVKNLHINWNAGHNGLYHFAMNVNAAPWYVNLTNSAQNFNSANPKVTFANTGIAGLDGTYSVTLHNNNLVLVGNGFTLYFSKSTTAPNCSGAKGLSDATPFNMFPNPATDNVTMLSEKDLNGSEITISDLTGKILDNLTITVQESTNSVTIDIPESVSSGLYLVKILNATGQSRIQKLIVK